MEREPGNHELIVRYLLGELPEQERDRLEQQYFNDDDLFDQVLVVEGELMDAYARGEMPARARQRFEAHFLTAPRLRRKAEVASALVEYATEAAATMPASAGKRGPITWWQSFLHPPKRALGLAVAMAALVIVVGGGWFAIETVRLRNQVSRIQAERAAALQREQELQERLAEQGAHNEQLADELQRERSRRESLEQAMAAPQRTPLGSITFVLTPDLVRGAGEPKRLVIPPHTDFVRLQVVVEQDDYPSYRATLETVEGKRIWSGGRLRVRLNHSSRVIGLKLPARLLTNGDDILTLSGIKADGQSDQVGEYYFRVIKK